MKKTLLLLTVLFFASISCNKENGGSNDPCAGISCKNGGKCINGDCDCPKQWTGPDCSKQKTPVKIFITKVDVTKFPATETSGAGWDLSSGPDIYPVISEGSTKLWEAETYYTDANSTLVYTFTPKTAITITKLSETHSISLYDYDDIGGDDYMGGITFTPYSDTNGFPATRVLSCSNCNTSYKIYLEYQW